MNVKVQKLAILLALSLVLMLTGCTGFGDPLDTEAVEKIDEQIRETIEKTFPLPEQVVIKTHVGDDLRFSTQLSVDEIVAFYQIAYAQRGFEEEAGSQILADSATHLFKKGGENDVLLEVVTNKEGSDVHLQLK